MMWILTFSGGFQCFTTVSMPTARPLKLLTKFYMKAFLRVLFYLLVIRTSTTIPLNKTPIDRIYTDSDT